MGKLDGALGYLSGSMEYVADHGVEWRRQFILNCKQVGLSINCIDPTNKPFEPDMKIGENKAQQSAYKDAKDWTSLKKYVKQYRRDDLRFVDLSDFLVVSINPKVPQWGTANEVYVAETQHKPTFFFIEGGLAKMPNWLFPLVDLPEDGKRSNVFENYNQIIDELLLYDNGTIPMTDEWVLVRKYLDFAS